MTRFAFQFFHNHSDWFCPYDFCLSRCGDASRKWMAILLQTDEQKRNGRFNKHQPVISSRMVLSITRDLVELRCPIGAWQKEEPIAWLGCSLALEKGGRVGVFLWCPFKTTSKRGPSGKHTLTIGETHDHDKSLLMVFVARIGTG